MHATDKALRTGGTTSGSTTSIAAYGNTADQQFVLERQSDGTYEIKSAQNQNLNLSVPGANTTVGTDLELITDNNTEAQRWIFEPHGAGFRITSQNHLLRVVEAEGAGTTDGTLVQSGEYTGTTSNNQIWRLDAVPDTNTQTIAYWNGDLSGLWNAKNGNNTNWATGYNRTTDLGRIPDALTTVFFGSSTSNLQTTLGQNFSIPGLIFDGSAATTIGGTHNLTLGGGGISLSLSAKDATINTTGQLVIGANQTWTNASNNVLTVTSPISGNVGLTIAGAGTTIFAGDNLYTGNTTVSVGTLQLGTGGTTGNLLGNVTNNGSLIFNSSGDAIFNSVISGTGDVVKKGAGTLTLNKTNSYSGDTTIGAGQGAAVLRAGANGALGTGTLTFDPNGNGSTARLELVNGSTLSNAIAFTGRANSSVAVENISGNNTLSGLMTLGTGGAAYTLQSDAGLLKLSNTGTSTLSSGKTLTLQGAGDGAVASVLAGSGEMTKAGAGTWTLSGANTYTGATTVSGGTLALNSSERIANTSNMILGGVTFSTGGFNETLGTLSLSGDAILDLGVGASTVSFSGIGTLTDGKTLQITNYTAGRDHLFIGKSALLTPAQLAQISFNGTAAKQLSSGEVTPVAPLPANTAPTITNISDQTINANTSSGALPFTVSDAETAASALIVSASSSNITLVPNTGTNLTLGGTNTARTLTLTPANNQSGTSTITLTVSDGTLTTSTSFLLTVTAATATATPVPTVIPEPTATPAPTATPEPTATPMPTATPEPTATPMPTATPVPTATPAPTATATPLPTATATPAPLAPQGVADAYELNEDASLSVAAAGVLSNDVHKSSAPLQAVLVAAPASGTLTLKADGSFVYTPSANFFGSDAFSYRATAGTTSSSATTVTLSVKGVKDAPLLDLNGEGKSGFNSVAVWGVQPVAVAPEALVSDVDSAQMGWAMVTLSSRPDSGAEGLCFSEEALQLAQSAGLSIRGSGAGRLENILSLQGAAPLAVYNAVLAGVLYHNTSAVPSRGERRLIFNVRDSDGMSAVARAATVQMGNAPPSVVSIVHPDGRTSGQSLVGQSRVVTTTFFDREGAGTISGCTFFIAPRFQVRYDAAADAVSISDGSSWSAGVKVGQARTLSNGFGSLDCQRTRVQKAGTQLKAMWSITPKLPLKGTQQLKARASDAPSTSPWGGSATWNITAENTRSAPSS